MSTTKEPAADGQSTNCRSPKTRLVQVPVPPPSGVRRTLFDANQDDLPREMPNPVCQTFDDSQQKPTNQDDLPREMLNPVLTNVVEEAPANQEGEIPAAPTVRLVVPYKLLKKRKLRRIPLNPRPIDNPTETQLVLWSLREGILQRLAPEECERPPDRVSFAVMQRLRALYAASVQRWQRREAAELAARPRPELAGLLKKTLEELLGGEQRA